MAAPTVLQMIYGKPKISAGLDDTWPEHMSGTKIFSITLLNKHIKSAMLRKWVRRETAYGVSSNVVIREFGTNKELHEWVALIKHTNGTKGWEVDISPTLLPYKIDVLGCVDTEQDGFSAIVNPGPGNSVKTLPEGTYELTATINVSDPSELIQVKAKIYVGTNPQSSFWSQIST